MKLARLRVTLALLACVALWASPALAAKKKRSPTADNAALTPEQVETNYTQAIEKRTADILSALDLKDPAKAGRVHDALIEHYRALRSLPAAKDNTHAAPATALHNEFVAKLAAELAPEQVEQVKDKLTYNKVKVTYDAYCQIVPGLTEKHKARILALLKEAREEAMEGGSSEEKSAIFKKYKGKVNTYLSGEGYDVAKAYKDWGARLKEKTAEAAK